jgi:hypothetical protein
LSCITGIGGFAPLSFAVHFFGGSIGGLVSYAPGGGDTIFEHQMSDLSDSRCIAMTERGGTGTSGV